MEQLVLLPLSSGDPVQNQGVATTEQLQHLGCHLVQLGVGERMFALAGDQLEGCPGLRCEVLGPHKSDDVVDAQRDLGASGRDKIASDRIEHLQLAYWE